MNKRGFTLIELLVVIAIIGVLAAIVLVSLVSAKKGGEDSSIESDLNSATILSEMYLENHANYNAFCTAADGLGALSDDIIKRGSQVSCLSTVDAQGWAIEATLSSNPALFNCLDSHGHNLTRSQFLFVPDCTVPWPN